MPTKASVPRWGFPLQQGQSTSYWLQQAQNDELLRYGSDDPLSQYSDTVIIESGTGAAVEARKAFLEYRNAGGVTDDINVDLDPVSAAKRTEIIEARAYYTGPGAALHPWKLAAHIMRENLANGVALHTFTTVREVERSAQAGSRWNVVTDRGAVLCNRVVHATNAYAGAYEPVLREAMDPSVHICVQSKRQEPAAHDHGTRNSYTVMLRRWSKQQKRFDAWVKRNAEHCVNDSFTNVKPVTESLLSFAGAAFDETSPCSSELVLHSSWSGILGMTPDRMPLVGEVPGKDGQWVCVGLNGYGMTKVFTAPPGLVKLMSGAAWAETDLP